MTRCRHCGEPIKKRVHDGSVLDQLDLWIHFTVERPHPAEPEGDE